MPPKKAPAKAAPKAKVPPCKPVAKPGPKSKASSNASSSSNHKKRKSTPEEPQPPLLPFPPTPEWDENILSNNQREKRRFKLSMSTMNDFLSEAELISMASSLTGSSQNTWGISSSAPIEGSRRPAKRARGTLPFGGRRGKGTGGEFEQNGHAYAMMMAHMNGQAANRRVVGVNCPTKSRLLGLSLEIREMIYGYLLIYPKPIVVKDDWTSLERNPYISHALMYVCKQFARECTVFLFKNNSIISLIRAPTYQFRRYEEPVVIPDSALALYRNIILDCALECWNTDWLEKTTLGIKRLVNAKTHVDTLTLSFMPQRVGFSSTAHGMEGNPLTFADFLWFEGDFMKTVRALSPKTLVIVIKKAGRIKLVVGVDMKGLRVRKMEEGFIVTEENLRISKERIDTVEYKLRSLERLYEEIFEDHLKAVREGKCELLDESVVETGEKDIFGIRNSSQSQPFRSKSETVTVSGQLHAQDVNNDSPWVFGIQGTIEERMKIETGR